MASVEPKAPPNDAAPRRRPQLRQVRVRRVERLSPHLVRVTFTGESLAGFGPPNPTAHLKLFLPPPGEAEPAYPSFGPGGIEWPADRARPIIRTYTPRRFDAATGALEVEFALHGTGPASTWAANAQPGDLAAVAGPSRGYAPDPAADWYLIAGDETALPAIGTLLEALPATTPAQVYVEIGDAADALPLPARNKRSVTWLYRRGDELAGVPLELAIRRATLPTGAGRVWIACEASAVRRIRRHLLEVRGLDRAAVVTRGYWKYGEADHPDHDTGED